MYNILISLLDSIFEEIEKYNTTQSNTNESEQDKNNRIANIVFSQLLPTTDNMLGFQLDKEKVKEIIFGFANQYNISDELKFILMEVIKSAEYKKSLVNDFTNFKHEFNEIEIIRRRSKSIEIVNFQKLLIDDYFQTERSDTS